jgi:CRISPR/Cas system-associated protein Csx1
MSLTMSVSAQKIDSESIGFLKKFCKAVVTHKKSKVIKCMDHEYRTNQIEFLKGNKQQFVDELFGGYDVETDEYVNVKLDEIENIVIENTNELSNGTCVYTFLLITKDRTVMTNLDLVKKEGKFGFVGAVG